MSYENQCAGWGIELTDDLQAFLNSDVITENDYYSTDELWFDSLTAYEIFMLCETQWRVGYNGKTGLDYSAVIPIIGLYEISRQKQLMLLEEVKSLETGCLNILFEYLKKEGDKREREQSKK